MKVASRVLLATLLTGAMALSLVSNASKNSSIISDTLLKATQSWDGESYKGYLKGKPEISIVKITVPAHTVLDWHTHPIPNAAYVLSGHITVEKQSTGQIKTIRAGDALAETVGTVHRG